MVAPNEDHPFVCDSRAVRDRLNLSNEWLAENLHHPENWSVRDRDDIVLFIVKKRQELDRFPETRQPARTDRERELARLEDAMARYVELQ